MTPKHARRKKGLGGRKRSSLAELARRALALGAKHAKVGRFEHDSQHSCGVVLVE